MSSFMVLFVCTGNSCRSPMAEYYFRHLTVELGLGDVRVKSAGLAAIPGLACSEQALIVLQGEGISAEKHRTQPLSYDLLQDADLVVTMTRNHRESIVAQVPEAGSKVRTLLSFSGNDGDVSDPFGSSVKEYKQCLAGMKPALCELAELIRRHHLCNGGC